MAFQAPGVPAVAQSAARTALGQRKTRRSKIYAHETRVHRYGAASKT